MRIQGNSSTNKSGGAKKTSGSAKAEGSSFDSLISGSGAADETQAAQSAQDISSIGSLLMLQEVDERESGRKHAIKKGQTALQYLEDVRFSLLMGRMPREVVTDLQKLVGNWRDNTDDPKLNAVLDDIELRAAVELAKIEKGREKRSSS